MQRRLVAVCGNNGEGGGNGDGVAAVGGLGGEGGTNRSSGGGRAQRRTEENIETIITMAAACDGRDISLRCRVVPMGEAAVCSGDSGCMSWQRLAFAEVAFDGGARRP